MEEDETVMMVILIIIYLVLFFFYIGLFFFVVIVFVPVKRDLTFSYLLKVSFIFLLIGAISTVAWANIFEPNYSLSNDPGKKEILKKQVKFQTIGCLFPLATTIIGSFYSLKKKE
jgi:hypothetical protein